MSNAKQLFNRILVNNVEINIDELDANNGQYQLPSGETQATVKFELKDKTTIPTNVFNNNPQVKSVKLASTIETIENGAFDGTSLDKASIEAITYINPIAYITSNRYTLEEAYAYNIQLPEAWKYGRVKIASQPAVSYTNAEVEENNKDIEGTVKIGDPVEEIFINNYSYIEYIHDLPSWSYSFNNNGILAKYYETYPDNDLIASDGSNKTASFNDRIYLGTITGEENEKRFKAGWSEKSQSLTNESDPSEVYYIKRLDEESPYYGTDNEWKAQYDKFHGMSWQLYSDALLTTPIEGKEIYIRTLVFDGFTHTYAAMIANGGKLPWIGAWFTQYFPEEAGVHMIFKYEGKDDVRPWGDRVFGKGEGQKVWGFASVSDEFNDNTLAISDCGGGNAFDYSKFSLILEKVEYDTYDKVGANTVNSVIRGALLYDQIKTPEVLEVLYTNDEVNTHNLTIPGAVNVGDLKPVEETPNTGTLDVDYEVGYKYTLPLMYTERSGQNRVQEIGTAKVQIIEIDKNEELASQYRLKIKVIEVNITNPLTGVDIDYESEILNKYFYTQETFITADMDMFMTLPGFTGVESFFAMKGEGDTYHPELENFYGVTDYSIKRNTLELNPEID